MVFSVFISVNFMFSMCRQKWECCFCSHHSRQEGELFREYVSFGDKLIHINKKNKEDQETDKSRSNPMCSIRG
jgi:hypothetical protein